MCGPKEVSLAAAEANRIRVVAISYVGGGIAAGTTELVGYFFHGVVGRILMVMIAVLMFQMFT